MRSIVASQMLAGCRGIQQPRKEIQLTVIVVVANDKLFKLTILAHLTPDVLVESVEMVLELAWVHFVLRVVGRVLIHVGHQDGLRVGRLDMLARAPVAVAACADLVVEGAIDLVLLGTEDGGEIVGHDCGLSESRRSSDGNG
jgi:hypothetical protein